MDVVGIELLEYVGDYLDTVSCAGLYSFTALSS